MAELGCTHTCFDDALDFMSHRLLLDLSCAPRLTLVHAICVAPGDQRPYAHAWVEETIDGETSCWDCGLLAGERVYYVMPQVEYYATRLVRQFTKYSVPQALHENLQHNNYGPWDPTYLALCTPRGAEAEVLGVLPGGTDDVSETHGDRDR